MTTQQAIHELRACSVPQAPPARPRWKGFALGAVCGLVFASAAWAWATRPRQLPDQASSPFDIDKDTLQLRPGATLPTIVETEDAQIGAALPHPPVPARVSTIESMTAPSFAPLSGRVVDLKVRIGARVHKGDKLVEVRTPDLAAMHRELRGAQLAVRTRQAIVDRLGQLVESRAASNHDLMVAKSELEDARFSVQAADSKLRSLMVAQNGDAEYWVLATRSGTVVQLDAMPGKQVGPETDKPIATVADLDEVLVLADVPQRFAADLNAGEHAMLLVPATKAKADATIETVSEVVDPDRQTVPVRLRAQNPDRMLRPNSYVDVVFTNDAGQQHLLVPSSAVVTDGDASVVFVQTGAGTLQRRAVRTGMQTREKIEVLSGLKPGEKVVTRGALLLLNALNVEE